MSGNLSVGAAASGGYDRAVPEAVSVEKQAALGKEAQVSYKPVFPINSTAALRDAELKGEYYTISDEQMVRAIERAIKAMQGKNTSLEFSFHKSTKTIAVKVIDRDSGEIIREIPPEKNLDFVAKMWEMAGIIVDERR